MLVVVSQMDFFRNASLGFDKESLVTVPVPNDSLSLSRIDVLEKPSSAAIGHQAREFQCIQRIG